MDKLTKILDEAMDNIREDRKLASILLEDVVQWIGQQTDRHAEVGVVASKYLETLQRSNEQFVKIAAILKSRLNNEYGDLESDEKDDLYNELEEPTGDKKV
jgi:hypothetical protein